MSWCARSGVSVRWPAAPPRNDVPPLHHVTVDLDPITEAIIALARHDATCPECETTLPDAECDTRKQLKACWRRTVREGALRAGVSPRD